MPTQGLPEALSAEVSQLDEALKRAGTRERATQEKRYLKSELHHYGVPVPVVRRVSKEMLRELGRLHSADELLLVQELWHREVHELRSAAVECLVHGWEELDMSALPLIERMLREGRTWALVDPLAIKVVGPLALRYPQAMSPVLSRWARDGDRWLRRSALLAHLLPVRNGETGSLDAFFECADTLLEDQEFFIRKAIGWVLREGTKKLSDEVYDWLLPRAERASAVTIREASKHLAPEQQNALLQGRQ